MIYNNGNNRNGHGQQNRFRPTTSMIKLNIEQQTDEVRDIENFVRDLDPIAVVELQAQQVRRLIYFAKKGIRAYKEYRTKLNPALSNEINLNEDVEA